MNLEKENNLFGKTCSTVFMLRVFISGYFPQYYREKYWMKSSGLYAVSSLGKVVKNVFFLAKLSKKPLRTIMERCIIYMHCRNKNKLSMCE